MWYKEQRKPEGFGEGSESGNSHSQWTVTDRGNTVRQLGGSVPVMLRVKGTDLQAFIREKYLLTKNWPDSSSTWKELGSHHFILTSEKWTHWKISNSSWLLKWETQANAATKVEETHKCRKSQHLQGSSQCRGKRSWTEIHESWGGWPSVNDTESGNPKGPGYRSPTILWDTPPRTWLFSCKKYQRKIPSCFQLQ